MSHKECGNCEFFVAAPAEGWKGGSRHELLAYLEENGLYVYGWPGECRFQPAAQGAKSDRVCSHWMIDPWFLETMNDMLRRRGAWKEMQREQKRAIKAEKKLKALRVRLK